MSSDRFNPNRRQRSKKKNKYVNEGSAESRMARVSFKKYLREIEEHDEDFDLEEDDEDNNE